MQGERRGIERTQRDRGARTNGRNRTGRERRRGKAPYRERNRNRGPKRKKAQRPQPARPPYFAHRTGTNAQRLPRDKSRGALSQPSPASRPTSKSSDLNARRTSEPAQAIPPKPNKTREKGDLPAPPRYDEVACQLASGSRRRSRGLREAFEQFRVKSSPKPTGVQAALCGRRRGLERRGVTITSPRVCGKRRFSASPALRAVLRSTRPPHPDARRSAATPPAPAPGNAPVGRAASSRVASRSPR